MRRLIPALFLLILASCSTNPMKEHYDNWVNVTRSLSSQSKKFSSCKANFIEKMDKKYVIYTFNIYDGKSKDVSLFNDPYKISKEMHDCVSKKLSEMSFHLKKGQELRNGYLLINKNSERFNYILY